MKNLASRILKAIERYLHTPWYPVLVATVVAADFFLLAVPNDVLLVTAVLARPQRWFSTAMLVALGSTIGGALLCIVLYWNPEYIKHLFPSVFQSSAWQSTSDFLHRHGLLAVFLGALGPIPQQPFIVLGALSGIRPPGLLTFIFLGRAVKYGFIGFLASKFPHVLKSFHEKRKASKTHS